MAVSTTTAAELTREQLANLLVKPLEEASKFLAAGPRIFDTSETLRIPKLGAPTAVSFVGENEQIPEADPDFDEVAIRVVARYDAKPLNAEAVIKLTGITI